MEPRVSVVIFLCVAFATANSSPVENKGNLDKKVENLDSGSLSAETGNESSDDLLRPKKSPTTTFCVEIKPGNDQPTVVICDPSKDNQTPIPPPPTPQPLPPPPPAPTTPPPPPPPPSPYPSQIPILIPEPPQPQFEPLPYEPLIIIPQPQIPPYFQPPPPQIILLRDPSCSANNPGIIPGSLPYGLAPARLYSSQQLSRAAGYDPADEALQRSLPGLGINGLSAASGLPNPLDLIYSTRGPSAQQPSPPITLPSLSSNSPSFFNPDQNPGAQQQRPYIIQCNPTLTPLPQQSYRSNVGTQGQAPILQQAARYDASTAGLGVQNHDSSYNGQESYPMDHPHSVHHQGITGHQSKSSVGSQRGNKNSGEMRSSHNQQQKNGGSQQRYNNQMSGIPTGGNPAGGLSNPQDLQKSGPPKSAQDSFKNTGTLLNEANAYGVQGQRSSIPLKNNRQQALQSQYRQQMPMPSMERGQFQQNFNPDMSPNQRTMERMRSAAAQGNVVPPYVNIQSSNSPKAR